LKKKTIIITIEITSRELESKILLASFFANNNFRVYLTTTTSLHILYNKLSSCIFFHKSTYEKKIDEIKKNLGAKIVFLDEETGFAIPYSNMFSHCKNRFFPYITGDKYYAVFTLNKKYKYLLSDNCNSETKFYDTGWPRIDLWRKEFRNINFKKINEIKIKYKSFYLMISSFNVITEDILNDRRQLYKNNPKQIAIEVDRFNAFQNYVKLIKELSIKLTVEEKIVIRPHPSENIGIWKKIFKNMSNIIFIKDEYTDAWLLSATSILQYASTLGVQAAVYGIPSVQYKVKYQKGITDALTFDVSEHLTTSKAVLEFLRKKSHINNNLSVINSISSLEGLLASEKIVNILSKVDIKKENPVLLNKIDFLKAKPKHYLYILNDLWSKLKRLGKPTFTMSVKEKRPNGLNKDEIYKKLNEFVVLQQGDIHSFKCDELANELICIEKKEKK